MSDRNFHRSAAGERIALLDLGRSLAVCAMAVYHALWDLAQFGVCALPPLWAAWCIGGCFILISGMSAGLSRNPLKRGFFVFCAGLVVSAGMAFMHLPVQFGILQLLGVCMMLFGAVSGKGGARQGPGFFLLCLALFAGTWLLTAHVTVRTPYLYPLGFRTASFYSADYYPLLPWGFLFLAGTAAGARVKTLQRCSIPPWLSFPGRYSLWIYLLHQPVLYGLCWLIFS